MFGLAFEPNRHDIFVVWGNYLVSHLCSRNDTTISFFSSIRLNNFRLNSSLPLTNGTHQEIFVMSSFPLGAAASLKIASLSVLFLDKIRVCDVPYIKSV